MSVHITIAVRVEILTHPFEGRINIEIIILFEDCCQGKLYPTSRSQCQPTSGDLAVFSSTVQPWFEWMHAGIPSFLMSQPWHGVVVYGLHCWELHRQLRKIFPASSNSTAYLFPATCRPRGSDMPPSPGMSALCRENHFLDSLAPLSVLKDSVLGRYPDASMSRDPMNAGWRLSL